MKNLLSIILTALFLLLVGCGNDTADKSKVASTESATPTENVAKKKTLLFFMNPNGRPCQVQDEILYGMSDQIASKKAQLQYVKTTEMATALPIFEQYGIRALPTIIILDENGAEKKRFAPGVQSQEALLAAL